MKAHVTGVFVSTAGRWWDAALEADVRRVARELPVSVQGQEGGSGSRQLSDGGGDPAHQHQGLSDRHLLQRHQEEERAETDHVRVRVPVPGRGPGGHVGLDQGHTGEQQPGRGEERESKVSSSSSSSSSAFLKNTYI